MSRHIKNELAFMMRNGPEYGGFGTGPSTQEWIRNYGVVEVEMNVYSCAGSFPFDIV